MRTVLNPQLTVTETDIGAIRINLKSRDDIPKLLLGLQHIYTHLEIREAVFEILKGVVPNKVDGKGKARISLGRPGMEQWRILVLGTLRLCLNVDYDRVVDLANHHVTIRKMVTGSARNSGNSHTCSLDRPLCRQHGNCSHGSSDREAREPRIDEWRIGARAHPGVVVRQTRSGAIRVDEVS